MFYTVIPICQKYIAKNCILHACKYYQKEPYSNMIEWGGKGVGEGINDLKMAEYWQLRFCFYFYLHMLNYNF